MSLWVTADLPGVGGRLGDLPEDFQVREVPAYEPSGGGEHLILEVTRRELSTPELACRLARSLELPPSAVGWAGLKDRHALATQRLSLPAVEAGEAERAAASLEGVLEARALGRHHHKLRRGHLRGNRFAIRLRGVVPGALERARRIAGALAMRGWPNFFGPQRFGREGDNARRGREILLGRRRERGWKRDFLISAFQAELFNRYLARRLAAGDFRRLLPGDVCAHLPRGGLFVVGDPGAETRRLECFEISPTGPLFGYRMFPARGEAARREQEVLEEAGIASLEPFRKVHARGTRRRLRLPLEEFTLEEEEGDLVLGFFLPAGSYATVLLGEFMKGRRVWTQST